MTTAMTIWDYLTLTVAFGVIGLYAYVRLKRMFGRSSATSGGCCGCSSGGCSSSGAPTSVSVAMPKKCGS
jgi:hypothetical protein